MVLMLPSSIFLNSGQSLYIMNHCIVYTNDDFAGRLVLEALILTSGVVISLTGYTFWASKKGKDFSFLGPILFAGLMVLLLTSFLQVHRFLYHKADVH